MYVCENHILPYIMPYIKQILHSFIIEFIAYYRCDVCFRLSSEMKHSKHFKINNINQKHFNNIITVIIIIILRLTYTWLLGQHSTNF